MEPPIAFSFGLFFPTTQTKTGPGSVKFIGVEEFSNASYSVTKVTFKNSAHLNQTVMDCNGEINRYIYKGR